MGCTVTVVVMAFNEGPNLEAVVHDLRKASRQSALPCEILVVDDGSSDGTGAVADRLARELDGIRVVHHASNGGLGAVYRTGFLEARGDLVTFFPADGQFEASAVERFVAAMDGADMVLGYLETSTRPLLGRVLSSGERLLYRMLFGRLPRFQGLLMVRRSVLDRFELTSRGRGWAVVMELIIRTARAGCRIRTVPTALRPRLSGTSKVQNPRTMWSNLRQTIALRRQL